MKKYIIISILFFLFIAIIIKNNNNNTSTVFNEEKLYYSIEDMINEGDQYNTFYLKNLNNSFNTKSFISEFSSLINLCKINSIYPSTYNLESNIKFLLNSYSFYSTNYTNSLINFYKFYTDTLKSYNKYDLIDYINAYGINIDVVSIECLSSNLYGFLKSNPTIKYSLSKDGVYQQISDN